MNTIYIYIYKSNFRTYTRAHACMHQCIYLYILLFSRTIQSSICINWMRENAAFNTFPDQVFVIIIKPYPYPKLLILIEPMYIISRESNM